MTARRRHSLAEVLGPLEGDIMDVVWQNDQVTVRDVHEELNKTRPMAYTTVMTTMGRLADKGLLAKDQSHAAHRYRARVSREQYARSTVKSVVDWLVSHFPDPAVSYFIDRVERGDQEVIDRLRAAIDQKKSQRGGG